MKNRTVITKDKIPTDIQGITDIWDHGLVYGELIASPSDHNRHSTITTQIYFYL